MPIPVYDFRKDIANVVVHPEIRARFMRMEPAPAGRMHSHDLGGEIFLVLDGLCEFIIEDERVTCKAGELIYVPPLLKHTLHAVGDQPCTVYLSVTPHVEPTHTIYDESYNQLPPRFGSWRGKDPDPNAGTPVARLVEDFVGASNRLAELAQRNAAAQAEQGRALVTASEQGDQPAAKATADAMWIELRDTLQHVRELEARWSALAPRTMPTT